MSKSQLVFEKFQIFEENPLTFCKIPENSPASCKIFGNSWCEAFGVRVRAEASPGAADLARQLGAVFAAQGDLGRALGHYRLALAAYEAADAGSSPGAAGCLAELKCSRSSIGGD